MKKVLLAAAVVLGAASAFALSGTFRIVPNAGVTTIQLPQSRLNAITRTAGALYADGVQRANDRYEQALRELGLDPAIDHSGDLLNEQVQTALRRREIAIFDAKHDAAAWAAAECGRLCHVEFID